MANFRNHIVPALTVLLMASGIPVQAQKNISGMWALHYAGPHNSKANTCSFALEQCWFGGLAVDAPAGPADFDVYIIAVDVQGIAGARFGLYGDGHFYFYPNGWIKCSDFEIPTQDWPGCGEGNAITWTSEQPGPNVTMGLLHVYAYGQGRIWTGPDPRKGIAEWCDGSTPEPICVENFDDTRFAIVGFGVQGCNPCYSHYPGCTTPGFDLEIYGACDAVSTQRNSWGAIKALYR